MSYDDAEEHRKMLAQIAASYNDDIKAERKYRNCQLMNVGWNLLLAAYCVLIYCGFIKPDWFTIVLPVEVTGINLMMGWWAYERHQFFVQKSLKNRTTALEWKDRA